MLEKRTQTWKGENNKHQIEVVASKPKRKNNKKWAKDCENKSKKKKKKPLNFEAMNFTKNQMQKKKCKHNAKSKSGAQALMEHPSILWELTRSHCGAMALQSLPVTLNLKALDDSQAFRRNKQTKA